MAIFTWCLNSKYNYEGQHSLELLVAKMHSSFSLVHNHLLCRHIFNNNNIIIMRQR